MESNHTRPQLYYHTINHTNATDDSVEQLFALSRAVFSEYEEENEVQNHDRAGSSHVATWLTNIRLPSAIITYTTSSPTADPSTALGVFYGAPKTQPEIGYELFHLNVAAVSPASRGLGIFPVLMDRVKQHARACGYKEMTVCTYPQRFVKMYRILREHGWQEVAWQEPGVKVLLKLSLE